MVVVAAVAVVVIVVVAVVTAQEDQVRYLRGQKELELECRKENQTELIT